VNLKVSEAIKKAENFLKTKSIPKPRLDCEVLMESLLGFNQAELYANLERYLSSLQFESYSRLIERRGNREPTQYIIQSREFWSLDFRVDKSVLIPRPETEILIERVLVLRLEKHAGVSPLRILDIGTGCGNIAIALAKEIPAAKIIASDISLSALKIAMLNAKLNGVKKRIEFVQGNLLEPFCNDRNLKIPPFNIIVSNPPYIPSEQINELSPEVSKWEPRTALDGGIDGLDFYRKIIAKAGDCLVKEGFLLLEIGEDQAEKIKEIASFHNAYKEVKVYQDYSGKNRVIEIWKK